MKALITGGTGFTGELFLKRLLENEVHSNIFCLTRQGSFIQQAQEEKNSSFGKLSKKVQYIYGDSSLLQTWKSLLDALNPEVIIHIASIRHTPKILKLLNEKTYQPRLIVVGTTGVYSQYNHYSEHYRSIEKALEAYSGSYCLLRPTMIYGSHRDKNLHKLIRFCDRYGFFPVFGSGQCLLQPVHADDLAQALLSVFLNPKVEGAYNLSGGTVVTFLELLSLVEKLLGRPVRPLNIPYQLGVWSVTLSETLLGTHTPVRREQILRLQEDKAYSHEAASRTFSYAPRSLEAGLRQEIEILKAEGILSR